MMTQESKATVFKLCCFLAFSSTFLLALEVSSVVQAEEKSKKVLVHYMPWYASKPVSGYWGWHWTMNHFNPDTIKPNGQREAASHNYPLIDLYDSNDANVLECQVQLMKLSGIDGVIVDWYGTQKFRDYAEMHRNTQHLIKHIKRAGLQFAICYEDQTIKHMVEEKHLLQSDALPQGKKALDWLDKNWFADDAYVKINDQPMLLVFGPQYFNKQQWGQLVNGLTNRPLLFGLPHLMQSTGIDGAFGWPPVTGGREIDPEIWRKYLNDLYTQPNANNSVISVAFPGFQDIYQQANLHDSYGSIDAREDKTFTETFDLALKSPSQIIQIATWNDYGEGTVVEPTKEMGYRYLEIIQNQAKSNSSYETADLRLPVKLYHLKQKHMKNPAGLKELEKASAYLFDGQCDQARMIIDRLGAAKD